MNQARQGDVFLVRVERIPDNAKPIAKGECILAHGEVTGHAHRIVERQAEMFDGGGGAVYLSLPVDALLKHEEHAPVELPAGNYRVVRQMEYTPAEVRRVED